jgi:hypothetical protein
MATMQFKDIEIKVHEKAQQLQGSAFFNEVKTQARRDADKLKDSIRAGSAKLVKGVENISPKTVVTSGITMLGIGAEIGLGDQLYNLSSTDLLMHKAAFGSSYVLVNVGAFMAVLGLAVAARKHEERKQREKSQEVSGTFTE